MNRTKIEEMLKEYKSLNRSVRSYEENVILDGKIEVLEELTSLLAEDGGEVKSLPDDIREFIRIATIEIQSHRSKSDEQLDSLFQKAYQLYSKYNVEASQQAPSADTCTEDKHIKGCKCEAPSATVDEPKHLSSAQRQRLFDLIVDIAGYHLMDDELNAIEGIVYPRTYPYTLKDSQQPTVDVDSLANRITLKMKDESIQCGGYPYSLIYNNVSEAIQEALRGSYTRQDMIRFRHFDCSDAVSGEQALRQYDTERGKPNG